MISIILKREWLRFRPSIFPAIMFSILLTLTFYLVIGFPFYSVINTINGIAAGDFFKGYPEDAYIKAGLTEVKVDYFQGQITKLFLSASQFVQSEQH